MTTITGNGTTQKQAPLDVIFTVGLMIVLVTMGFVLVRRKNDAARFAGMALLTILLVNVLHTSNFWLSYINAGNTWVTTQFNNLQKWKQQTGA